MAFSVRRSIGDAMNSISVLCQIFSVSRQARCESAKRNRKSELWVVSFGAISSSSQLPKCGEF
jgi:hypothetical protein